MENKTKRAEDYYQANEEKDITEILQKLYYRNYRKDYYGNLSEDRKIKKRNYQL